MLDPQPEGGYPVTSPVLPELIPEGDALVEALANAVNAFAAVAEICEDEGRTPRLDTPVDDTDGQLPSERRNVTFAVVPIIPAPCSIRLQSA